MIGYKTPQGLKRLDILRPAFAAARNEDMTREFAIAPKTEEDQEKCMWIENNCPNQFIADCMQRVLRKLEALGQAEFVNKQHEACLAHRREWCKIADVYHQWVDTPEVNETLLEEKKALDYQAREFWDIPVSETPQLASGASDAPSESGPPENSEDTPE